MRILIVALIYVFVLGGLGLLWWKKRPWFRRLEQAFALFMMFVLGPSWLIYGITDLVTWDLHWYTLTNLFAGSMMVMWVYRFWKTGIILPWERRDDKL